jgi:histidinol-phosphate aminotransferase
MTDGGRRTPPVRMDLADVKPYKVPLVRTRVELDSNENPWNLPPDVVDLIQSELDGLDFNRYPDNGAARLRSGLALRFGVDAENVMAGNGSNEVLLNLFLAFGGAGRTALLFVPTYSMHPVLARVAMTEVILAPLAGDFSLTTDAALNAVGRYTPNIVFVTNPNNPTGSSVAIETIEAICRSGDHLVVVDEAYGEFGGATCLPLIAKYKNLAIVKTFSKAWRLASARVGYCLADAGIIAALDKVRLPYNLNALSMAAAAVVLENRDAVLASVAEIVSERARVMAALESIDGISPFPSLANFILFRAAESADAIFDRLMSRGVQVRNFNGQPGLDNCLRVTIGAPVENDDFLAALKESL